MIEYIHLFPVADMASAFWQSTLPENDCLDSLCGFCRRMDDHVDQRTAAAPCKRPHSFLKTFRDTSNPLDISARQGPFTHTPLEVIYQEGCRAVELECQAEGGGDSSDARLNMHQLERFCGRRSHLADEVLLLEDQMGLLATAVSAAPF